MLTLTDSFTLMQFQWGKDLMLYARVQVLVKTKQCSYRDFDRKLNARFAHDSYARVQISVGKETQCSLRSRAMILVKQAMLLYRGVVGKKSNAFTVADSLRS
jgi:hypothetical protein